MLKLTAQSISEKALLHEITTNGVTHSTPDKPIVSRDGQSGSAWVMSFLGAGLREPWLSSACDSLLQILEHFDSRQLATMGLAASSLLSGCILRSDRGHSGLMVRSEPKSHGSGKQIEGLGDKSEPVVIIDDAIGTGYSALKCAEILEDNGYEVEGVICVVSFSYDSGFGLLEERGFKVASLFDLYDDLAPIMQPELVPTADAHKGANVPWDNELADNGLNAFTLARAALHYGIEFDAMPKPPELLAHPISCEGGLTVSLRNKDKGVAIARGSVWRFPDEPEISPCEMLLRACWQIVQALPGEGKRSDWLNGCSLGITCFGSMEPCVPGQVNNDQFGLTCRSLDRPWVMGGALPQMPGIECDLQQLNHALFTNSSLRPLERYELFRHTATKLIEPDANWPPGGHTSNNLLAEADFAGSANSLLDRFAAILNSGSPKEEDNLFFWASDRLFVSIYDQDRLLACVGSRCNNCRDFDNLVHAAAGDPRMGEAPAMENLSLQISVLSDKWSDDGPLPFVVGRDALAVTVDGVEAILLPNVAIELNQDASTYLEMLLLKAGTAAEQVEQWTRYACRSWSKFSKESSVASETSFPIARRKPAKECPLEGHAQMWANWLARLVESGSFAETLNPLSGQSEGSASQALQEEVHLQLARFNKGSRYGLSNLPVPGTAGIVDIEATAYRVQTLGYCETENTEQLAEILCQSMAKINARKDWAAFWLSISALAGSADHPNAPTNRLVRRRAVLPCAPSQRLVRLSALLEWHFANPGADLNEHITDEIHWLSDCQTGYGGFNIPTSGGPDPCHCAQSAEILAKASNLFPDQEYRAKAERALLYLTSHGLKVDDTCAGLRTSTRNSLINVALTSAALGAYNAFAEHKR